jgi:hypothetical protein
MFLLFLETYFIKILLYVFFMNKSVFFALDVACCNCYKASFQDSTRNKIQIQIQFYLFEIEEHSIIQFNYLKGFSILKCQLA